MTVPIQPQTYPAAPTVVGMSVDILDRMERAVAKVRERLLRATAALNQAEIPYAVVGGNAVASWVATIDEGAARNTRDVDLLIRRDDLPCVTAALEQAGFVRDELGSIVIFRDSPNGKPREAIHLVFSGEKARPGHVLAAPDIHTVQDPANFSVITLDHLVNMKLTWYRSQDHMHLRDMIGIGLIDASWVPRLPPELAQRLQHILDTPDG